MRALTIFPSVYNSMYTVHEARTRRDAATHPKQSLNARAFIHYSTTSWFCNFSRMCHDYFRCLTCFCYSRLERGASSSLQWLRNSDKKNKLLLMGRESASAQVKHFALLKMTLKISTIFFVVSI